MLSKPSLCRRNKEHFDISYKRHYLVHRNWLVIRKLRFFAILAVHCIVGQRNSFGTNIAKGHEDVLIWG